MGMAVGWAVTAQETEGAWGLFFDCLKQNVDRIRKADGESLDGAEPFTTYALVSDDDSSSWKAAKNVFHAQRRYLCLWHVLQNFLRKSSMVSGFNDGDRLCLNFGHCLSIIPLPLNVTVLND